MPQPNDSRVFHQTLEQEARRIAATGQPSTAGWLAMKAMTAAIAAAIPAASEAASAAACSKALLLLAETDWDAAANAMALLIHIGLREAAGESDNVVAFPGRRS